MAATGGLSSGDDYLIKAARIYFVQKYQNPSIAVSSPIATSLSWQPGLHFRVHDHLTVVAEASNAGPYPLILQLRRSDVTNLDMPVSVYAICPEEVYTNGQSEFKRLIADGFGLLTVDANGGVVERAHAIPLIQQISAVEFGADIKGLPVKLRTRLAQAYDSYKHNPPTGTADIAEVMEGLVLRAGKDAAAKGWITNSDVKGGVAKILQAMQGSVQCNSAAAAIGAAQAYISMYRNIGHHFPKDKRAAAKKYRDCRHGFLEGLKKVTFFRDSMKNLGFSGGF